MREICREAVGRTARTPAAVLALSLAIGGMLAGDVQAQGAGGLNDTAAESECKLTHLRRTTSAAARSYILKACNFISLPSADFELSRQERMFHDCVLEVLPGTEDDRNAVELANACRDRAWAR